MILKVHEIVSDIQYEGKNSGYPTTFVKLYGCNLNCSYCASNCKDGRRKRMSIETILNYIFRIGNKYVCITGGEPLLQDNTMILVYELVGRYYNTTIYTNGSREIDDCLYTRSYSYIMELKCPSSKMSKFNIYSNLEKLQAKDEIKFVISDIHDYVFAKDIIKEYPTKAGFIFKPANDGIIKRELKQWLLEDKIEKAKLSFY